VNPTIESYDEAAQEYAEKTWNICLRRALDSFARYLIPGALTIDIGCGPGRDVELLRQRGGRVVGTDLSLGMLQEARLRVGRALVCADMIALPCASESFDGIWLCGALLHLPHAVAPQALAEARRLLRPDRPLYVSVQQGTGEDWNTTNGSRFIAYYQPDELASLIRAAGFAISESWISDDESRRQITWINMIALASQDCSLQA
jgi:SAM-dependent methyltransferase